MAEGSSIPTVALISLEPWDDVWRRNQHLGAALVARGAVDQLIFVTPPTGGLAVRGSTFHPQTGIEVVTPPLLVPRRYGGGRLVAGWVHRRLRGIDLLWINDPVAGRRVRDRLVPVVYDVTDDWRSMPQSIHERGAIVAAENELARTAATVVCSAVLASRWNDRYNVEATVIPNGIDTVAFAAASPRVLAGTAPHAVYVGTLHTNRVDVSLVVNLCQEWSGTVHLVGPNHFTAEETGALLAAGALFEGPVPAPDVPSWMKAADLLLCPHLVDDFTLSLDAIKAHEYLATDRPVVATPSSGFQAISAPGLTVAAGAAFVTAAKQVCGSGPFARASAVSWSDRAEQFEAVLRDAWQR